MRMTNEILLNKLRRDIELAELQAMEYVTDLIENPKRNNVMYKVVRSSATLEIATYLKVSMDNGANVENTLEHVEREVDWITNNSHKLVDELVRYKLAYCKELIRYIK